MASETLMLPTLLNVALYTTLRVLAMLVTR